MWSFVSTYSDHLACSLFGTLWWTFYSALPTFRSNPLSINWNGHRVSCLMSLTPFHLCIKSISHMRHRAIPPIFPYASWTHACQAGHNYSCQFWNLWFQIWPMCDIYFCHLVCNTWLYRTVLYKGWQNWSNLLDAWPHIVHDRYIAVFILYGSYTLSTKHFGVRVWVRSRHRFT